MICGKEAIHEALITKSTDFADRPEFYVQSMYNKDAKGCDDSLLTAIQLHRYNVRK